VPLQAQASGGTVYQWTPADGLSNAAISSPVAAPLVTTTYTVKVTDDLGCRNTKDLTVEVIQPADLMVSPWPDTAVCLGDPVHFHATGEEVYQWIGDTQGLSDPGIGDPVATPSVTTTYTVRGSDRKNCFPREKSVNVRVMSLPTVNAGQDVTMQVGETTQLHATGSSDVVSWQWTPDTYLSCGDCSSPVCDPLISMTYVIKVTNANTCHASDTVHIKLLCEEDRVRVPNAFTPNGDGVNDVFIIKGIAMVKHLVIFSRWGAKVFERNNFIAGDRNACWNGTSNGERCPAGTYVWFAEMECPSGGVFARKGTVILIR
jgi:gliding motility-associated-like protein